MTWLITHKPSYDTDLRICRSRPPKLTRNWNKTRSLRGVTPSKNSKGGIKSRLFYVGCTRAMRYLFVTYDRSLPSPFLDSLSDERWVRVERT